MRYTHFKIASFLAACVASVAGLLLLFAANTAHSDPLDIAWEKSDGDFTSVTLESVAAMPDGGLLLGGSITTSTALYSPSPAHLIRTDAGGKELWAESFWRGGGTGIDVLEGSIVALFTTVDGGFFCLEEFSARSFFNPSGQMGEFVIKTDASGNRLWETYYSNYQTGSPRVNAIAPAGDNGCVIAGTSGEGSFLTRFDSGGATVWKKVGTKMYVSSLNNLAASADGGFFLGSNKSIGSVTTMTLVKAVSHKADPCVCHSQWRVRFPGNARADTQRNDAAPRQDIQRGKSGSLGALRLGYDSESRSHGVSHWAGGIVTSRD